MEARRYISESGRDVVGEWLAALNDATTRAKVVGRITRLQAGNFGDNKSVGGYIREARVLLEECKRRGSDL